MQLLKTFLQHAGDYQIQCICTGVMKAVLGCRINIIIDTSGEMCCNLNKVLSQVHFYILNTNYKKNQG